MAFLEGDILACRGGHRLPMNPTNILMTVLFSYLNLRRGKKRGQPLAAMTS